MAYRDGAVTTLVQAEMLATKIKQEIDSLQSQLDGLQEQLQIANEAIGTLNSSFTTQNWRADVNMNTMTTTGFYWISTGVTNGPSGITSPWAPLAVIARNDTVRQVLLDSTLYQRRYQSGNWEAWRKLKQANKVHYATATTTASSNNSLSALTLNATITTSGNPVFISVTGDGNPAAAGNWGTAVIKRGSTTLRQCTAQSAGGSYNIPFGISYLDVVGAGTYTYTFTWTSNSGTLYLNESGNVQIPQLIVFEI